MKKVKYITTAIVYPNSKIHIGWIWECLGADWLARVWKSLGEEVFFVTGMDEHSINVERAARQQGLTPQLYCDQMAQEIQQTLSRIHMSHDRFIRTSDADHHWVVQTLVQRAFDRGSIYLAQYEGLYCESCEAYYTEKDLKNGLCPFHDKAPVRVSEENYFFRLSHYEEALTRLFEEQPDFLQPTFRRAEVLQWIRSGLKDFSISRAVLKWGIPLPFDPQQVVYVWFDALINYLTAAGLEFYMKDPESPAGRAFETRWPASVHIIGKDIVRFHCVYWPAILMALDLPLPKKVFAHGYLTVQGERISKTKGNLVTPEEVLAVGGPLAGVDALRYYLLAENSFAQDGHFSWESFMLRTNADLANDWGNLVNRSLSMVRQYFPDHVLRFQKSSQVSTLQIVAFFEALPEQWKAAAEAIDPSSYLAACLAGCRELNVYIDQMKPWYLAKQLEQREHLQEVLWVLLEGIRWLSTAWLTVLPVGTPQVFHQLGLEVPSSLGALKDLRWGEGVFLVKQPQPIYPRLERAVLNELTRG